MKVEPYLFFEGRCEEAMEFYRTTVGAKVDMMMRYKESPDKSHMPPNSGDKVMHATLRIGDATIMASDGNCTGKPTFAGFSLSYTAANEADADKVYKALGEGGQVQLPMTETFFAKRFGMVADKFGMGWMVIVPAPMPPAAKRA